MNALLRIALGCTLVLVSVVALVFVLKLLFVAAAVALVVLGCLYAFHFVRAFVRGRAALTG